MHVSVKDAALSLGVAEETIYRLIKQGDIPAHRVNEEYRFNSSELLEWATQRGMRISPDIFARSDIHEGEEPSLIQALEFGGVIRGIDGQDAAAVLRVVVDSLPLPPEVDREYVYEMMMARESLGSTGIGDGIAIPHVRNPVVLDVLKPSVTLCILKKAIEFRSPDGRAVDILFAIVSPTVRVHLRLLSRLALALRNGQFKAALRERAELASLLGILKGMEDGQSASGEDTRAGRA